jgi:hypothetical protein
MFKLQGARSHGGSRAEKLETPDEKSKGKL